MHVNINRKDEGGNMNTGDKPERYFKIWIYEQLHSSFKQTLSPGIRTLVGVMSNGTPSYAVIAIERGQRVEGGG